LMVGPDAMMTAIDMHGFSVSVMELADGDAALLTQPVDCPGWPGCHKVTKATVLPLPDGLSPIRAPASEHAQTKVFLTACCAVLIDSEDDLNLLDAKSGDGDTGATVATAAKALVDRLDKLPQADLTQLFPAIGHELTQTMGGSSGVILAIFFSAAGEACSSGQAPISALRFGLNRIKEVGGAKLGDRTMIDALEPALEGLGEGFEDAATRARQVAEDTAFMLKANAGRAAYVNATQLKGHTDPGAEAVARVFERLLKFKEMVS